ncbi:MAG TPA: SAVED domain-containing protein [Methylomirabilota bacterium]|nr:SAVED domain-containing protein [Methylomirabilota bacterium]
MWLRRPEQLAELGGQFHAALARLRELAPGCRRIHLFYAGPTGGAIILGQAVNPRMNPPVALYEYSRQGSPRYEHVATLSREEE